MRADKWLQFEAVLVPGGEQVEVAGIVGDKERSLDDLHLETGTAVTKTSASAINGVRTYVYHTIQRPPGPTVLTPVEGRSDAYGKMVPKGAHIPHDTGDVGGGMGDLVSIA